MLGEINGYSVDQDDFLGKGSFGSVYKAEKNGEVFAIKVFQTEFLKEEFGQNRFEGEIKALQKIDHPNVVKYHEHGTFEENEFEYVYIVMDFIEGSTLENYVGSVSEEAAKKIVKDIFQTLDYVHSQGVIHRDLKPANIIVDRKGVPIILDFGISKLIDYTSVTPTGVAMGSYAYMSPEQIRDSKEVDPRSDYFSIGVVLYELVTGKSPYDATNIGELARQIIERHPVPPSEMNPDISAELEEVILTLIEKEPHQRYQTVKDILAALDTQKTQKDLLLPMEDYFFVRLMHNEKSIIQKAMEDSLVENVNFPANFHAQKQPTLQVITSGNLRLIADPATARFAYTNFSETQGLKELPYGPEDQLTPIQPKDLLAIGDIKEFIKKVLDYQVASGMTDLVAPFFFSRDPDDRWGSINIQLLKEAVSYRDTNLEGRVLWGGVCIGTEHLYDDDVKNKILNRYVRARPDGFLVYGDQISNNSNESQLYHYSNFLTQLQESSGSPVVACRVSSLGLVFMSMGISGFSSGVNGLDSFSEVILSGDRGEGYGRDPKYYIPELLTSITLPKGAISKLRDISESSIAEELMCKCPYCDDLLENEPIDQKNSGLHYLYHRKNELAELAGLDSEARKELIIQKIDRAVELYKVLKGEDVKLITNTSFLKTWKSLLERE